MSFFVDVHRSIFDSSFYREVIHHSKLRVILFLVKLLILTALVSGFAQAYYLIHPMRGVAPLMEVLLKGLEVKDGHLYTDREDPRLIPTDLALSVINRFMKYPAAEVKDTFLMVDARETPAAENAFTSPIMLQDTCISFNHIQVLPVYVFLNSISDNPSLSLRLPVKIPYRSIVGKHNTISFDAATVQNLLVGKLPVLLINFIFISFSYCISTVFLSIFFLTLAAFIFRVDRMRSFGFFAKLACYSITPVLVGMCLVAISGVSADWTWHVFIVISTVIMFRAMVVASAEMKAQEKTDNLE